jgi:ADP-heptose:LPS heptosyltransferase
MLPIEPGRPPEIRTIAVFRALFLGDMLCASPALRELRRLFPRAEITLIGLPWMAELVERWRRACPPGQRPLVDRFAEFGGYPGIIEVPVVPERVARFFQEQRACGYDLAVQMQGSGGVANGLVCDLGARLRLGYRQSDDDTRLTLALSHRADDHEVHRWLQLVRVARIWSHAPDAPPSTAFEFPLFADDRARAAAALGALDSFAGPLVALHAGAKDPARRWSPERLAQLGDALATRYGARIVLTGGPHERPLTAAIRAAMHAPALDLAGATDLGTLAGVLERLALLVSNDTGVAHLAVATGTPSVVLFGPNPVSQWGPLDRTRHTVIDAVAYAGAGVDPREALGRLPLAPVLAACQARLEGALPVRCAA